MRRRLLAAILGTVALAVVLAGTGTYLLVRRQAVRAADTSLRAEVDSLAGLVTATGEAPSRVAQAKIVQGMRLEGISVLVRGPAGVVRGALPDGVDEADVPIAELEPGEARSGRSHGLNWASSTVEGTRGSVVTVVITRDAAPPRPPVGWFLLGGAIALVVSAAIAAWLSDSLTRPLRQAQAATVQIAGGDLTTRLPEPAPTDHEEVAELTRSINSMAAALAASRGLERQFLLSVSHDLRTPLTSIRGYADAIADGTAPEPTDAARIIGSEAERLARLVGDLLDLARLDAHAFRFEVRSVPVAEVVTETAEGFRPAAERAGVSLSIIEPSDPTDAMVDPDRLAQALANLLENALKHASGTVRVEAGGVAEGIAIWVGDDGPGIGPDDLPHVFERLYVTSRQPRRGVGGSGLGLAIVHELVSGMGGRAWVESPTGPGGGARFGIVVPKDEARSPSYS